MKEFLMVADIKAKQMTRIEYNKMRGWKLPDSENHLANEIGMYCEYYKHEHLIHTNWVPLDVFNRLYSRVRD